MNYNENEFLNNMEQLNQEANKLVEAIQLAEGQLKEFLITDLYNLVSNITRYNCATFLREYRIYSLNIHDAFDIAMGEALYYSLKSYDASKGVYFLTYYRKMVNWVLLQHLEKMSAKKRVSENDTVSLNDENVQANELEYQASETTDPSELILTNLEFKRLANEFIKIEPYGAVVLCEHLDREARKRAILDILGSETYGAAERKKVERIRKAFKKFLMQNGF